MPPDDHQASATPPTSDTTTQVATHPQSTKQSKNEQYATICSQIIKDQGLIVGAITYEQAMEVPGLVVNPHGYDCVITSDGKQVLADLVEKYRTFFGNAAVEVCRDAVSHVESGLTDDELPEILRRS